MTKISIAFLLLFFSMSSMGQSLDDINKLMDIRQFREAKKAIDAFMAEPKNSAKSDGWYYKGRIYNSLSYDTTILPSEAYDLKLQAFEAFKKTQQLDAKDLRLKVEGYMSYLDIYSSLFDLGAKFYNEKDFEKAFKSFSNALDVKDFILKRQYTYADVKLYPLDTALVLNTAISAMQAKNDAGTETYYRKLTDANVAGDAYLEVYEFLADYYNKKEDSVNLKGILDKGKIYYPKNDYWTSLELDNIRKKGDQALLFTKYEEMMAQNPSNFMIPYNYAIELFNSIYGHDAKPVDEKGSKAKLTTILKAAIANDKGIDATVLMTKHLYNVSSDLSIDATKVKGVKPEDVKKKADLVVQTKAQMDEFLQYAKIASAHYDALPTMKPVQRATYQELLTNMSEIYNYKKDTKTAAEIDKKKAAL
ncbi:MAG: hypothetical protein ACOYLO_04090 [Ferruginibacter sp.]